MEGRQCDAQADGPRPATERDPAGPLGQWPAIGVVGFVGFVVLALLLVFGTVISQLDQQLLAAVISLRTPELTVFASAVTRLGSTPMVATWLSPRLSFCGFDHARLCCRLRCLLRW